MNGDQERRKTPNSKKNIDLVICTRELRYLSRRKGLARAGHGGETRGLWLYVRKRVQRAIWVVVIMIAIAAGAPHAVPGPLALGGANRASEGCTAQLGTGNHRRTGCGGGGVRCRWWPSGADGRRGFRKDRARGETKGGAGGGGSSGARDRWAIARMRAGVMRGTRTRGSCGCSWDGGGWMRIAESTGGFE